MTHHPVTIPNSVLSAREADGADPCDLAEEAMPELFLGDLTEPDASWIEHHCASCRSCNAFKASYETVCSSLDACDDALDLVLAGTTDRSRTSLGIDEADYGFMESPVGDILVAASDQGLLEVSYLRNHDRKESLREVERRGFLVRERQSVVQPVVDQLEEYFASERREFDVHFDLRGVTEFTQDVLRATYHVPYGQVQTYGQIANAIQRPKASRAVGNALGRNPIPVIIPCHRVVLSSGAMGWYTGGPDIKQALLSIEGAALPAM